MDRIGDYKVEREIRRDDVAITYEAVHLVVGWGSAGTRDGAAPGDPARDVGALGALAFRGLTGRPYTGASAREAAPAAPAELAALIDEMLAETGVPAATDVRVRAAWLADTIVPRHTLPDMKAIDPFAVRINPR